MWFRPPTDVSPAGPAKARHSVERDKRRFSSPKTTKATTAFSSDPAPTTAALLPLGGPESCPELPGTSH